MAASALSSSHRFVTVKHGRAPNSCLFSGDISQHMCVCMGLVGSSEVKVVCLGGGGLLVRLSGFISALYLRRPEVARPAYGGVGLSHDTHLEWPFEEDFHSLYASRSQSGKISPHPGSPCPPNLSCPLGLKL